MISGRVILAHCALITTLVLGPPGLAQVADESVVDHLQLAAMLLGDGHYDRAGRALAEVDISAQSFDGALYYTVQGLIELQAQNFEQAAQSFDEAIRQGQSDDMIFVYAAQASFGAQDYATTLRALGAAGPLARQHAQLYLMKAASERELERYPEAWATLIEGLGEFPSERELARQQIMLTVTLGLYQEGAARGQAYLARGDAPVEDYLFIAESFLRSGELNRAQTFLEDARLKFPDDLRLQRQLSGAYAADGKLTAAADLLYRAALREPALIAEAAELYRRAGALERALLLNGQVANQAQKFRQRVAIELDRENYEAVAALEERLNRLGLLKEQNLAYALAYAQFKIGDFAASERWLRTLDEPALFEQATQLRRVMVMCADGRISCD